MAQAVLDAGGITIPTGELSNGVYDEAGNFYQLPSHIISDPTNLVSSDPDAIATRDDPDVNNPMKIADGDESDETEDEEEAQRRREEKGKGVLLASEMMTVKCRLSDRAGPAQDVLITIGKSQSVRVLTRKIAEEAGVSKKKKFFLFSLECLANLNEFWRRSWHLVEFA
jgi:hypothetical protein